MQEYLVLNRITKDQAWSQAGSFQGACENLGWLIADCEQSMVSIPKPKKGGDKNAGRKRK